MRRPKGDGLIGALALTCVICLACGAVSLLFATSSRRDIEEARVFRPALTAPATVVATDVKVERGKYGIPSYRPTVKFQFSYEGRTFTGERLRIEPVSTLTRKGSERFLAAMIANATAHFLPSEPNHAVLDPRMGANTAMGVWAASAVTCCCLVYTALYPPRRKYFSDELPIGTSRFCNGYITLANRGGPRSWVFSAFNGAWFVGAMTLLALPPGATVTEHQLTWIGCVPPALAVVAIATGRLLTARTSGALVLNERRRAVWLLVGAETPSARRPTSRSAQSPASTRSCSLGLGGTRTASTLRR